MIRKIKLIDCYDKQRAIWESADVWPFTLVCTGRQVGKVQPYSTLIHTPSGPKLLSDLKVGDDICGNGENGKVLDIFPHKDWNFKKITFCDGSITYAGDEHLWEVYDKITLTKKVINTLQLNENFLIKDPVLKLNSGDFKLRKDEFICIKTIEEGFQSDGACISVSTTDKTYVCDNSILTHNTTLANAKAFDWCIKEKGCKVGYFMPTYKQIDQNFNLILGQYAKVLKLLKCVVNKTKRTIYFPKTYAWIIFKSAESEDSSRGGTYSHLIVDEAAMIKDDIFEPIIRPTAASAGKTHLILSTPKGRNWFYEMYKLGETPNDIDGINSIRFPSTTSPYINQKEIERSQRQMSEAFFKQEFLAEFVDGASKCFNGLDQCLYDEREIMNRQKGAIQTYFGIDLGSTVDYTWIILTDQNGHVIDKLKCQGDWNTIKDKIFTFLTRWAKTRPIGYIEKNGVGAPIIDFLLEKPPVGSTIWKWNTTNSTKMKMIESLIVDVEQSRFKMPNWDDLKREILSMEIWWKGGKVFYGAPAGEHDDGVIALALARQAFKGGQSTKKILTGYR